VALFPGERVLLVRTELDVFARPDWFPQGIDSVEIATVTQQLRPEGRRPILLDLLIGVRPKRIFNVNSRLAWEVFSQYANRLRLWSELYAYMFCWDYDKTGQRTGYPVDFFVPCFDHLDARWYNHLCDALPAYAAATRSRESYPGHPVEPVALRDRRAGG
jgi:hypothetical protein